jgi:hypothetical protein
MRPLIAHWHLGLGKLHRRQGDHDQTQEHLTKTTAMYRDGDGVLTAAGRIVSRPVNL